MANGRHTEGDEGLLFEPTGEFLPSVLFKEISIDLMSITGVVKRHCTAHVSPSNEDGRGASDILDRC